MNIIERRAEITELEEAIQLMQDELKYHQDALLFAESFSTQCSITEEDRLEVVQEGDYLNVESSCAYLNDNEALNLYNYLGRYLIHKEVITKHQPSVVEHTEG